MTEDRKLRISMLLSLGGPIMRHIAFWSRLIAIQGDFQWIAKQPSWLAYLGTGDQCCGRNLPSLQTFPQGQTGGHCVNVHAKDALKVFPFTYV
jgi:hypothetical protein